MKFIRVYKQLISEGFSEEVSLGVIQLLTINLVKPIKKKHLTKERDYSQEIIDTYKELSFELLDEDVKLTIKLWQSYTDWDISNSLSGMGGCQAKTFKELLSYIKG